MSWLFMWSDCLSLDSNVRTPRVRCKGKQNYGNNNKNQGKFTSKRKVLQELQELQELQDFRQ